MKRLVLLAVLAIAFAVVLMAAGIIRSRFERDLALATERAAQDSKVLATRCGPIEGVPLYRGRGQGSDWRRSPPGQVSWA